MSRYSDNCDQRHKAYIDARFNAKDANELVGSVAVDIAEQVLKSGTADTAILDVYEKAKELAGQKADLAREAWEAYIRAYRIMVDQEKEMPSAVAAAEGITGNLPGQVGWVEGVPVMEADFDATTDGEGVQLSVGVLDGDGRELVVLQRIENTLSDIRQFLLGQVVRRSGVTDMSHDASLSVGGAPDGAGVGTSESTERVQSPVVPVMKVPPAVAAAEGDETKHSNGK